MILRAAKLWQCKGSQRSLRSPVLRNDQASRRMLSVVFREQQSRHVPKDGSTACRRRHREAHAPRRNSASLPASEKEFSKTVLTGEQAADDRQPGGKMFPNLRNKAFQPCGHADGGYVLRRLSGISHASTS